MQLRGSLWPLGGAAPRTQKDCRIGGWRQDEGAVGHSRSDTQLQALPLGPGPWVRPCEQSYWSLLQHADFEFLHPLGNSECVEMKPFGVIAGILKT